MNGSEPQRSQVDVPPPPAAAAARLGRRGGGALHASGSHFASETTARCYEQAAALCSCIAQAYAWRAGSVTGVSGHAWQAALTAIQLACLAFFLLAPRRAWQRWRVWAIAAMRLCLYHEPWSKLSESGLGQLLEEPASPGLLGGFADWLRLFIGLLPTMFAGLAFRLPPTAALAQQLAAVYLAVGAAGARPYCRSALLADPLSERRMGGLYRLLDAADVLSPLSAAATPSPSASSAPHAGAAGGTGEARCAALIYFQTLVAGVLLPVVLACRAAPLPPSEGEGQAAPQRRSARLQQQQRGSRARGRGGSLGLAAAACSQLFSWVDSLDAVLRSACTAVSFTPPTALLAWLLFSNCWLLAKALAKALGS